MLTHTTTDALYLDKGHSGTSSGIRCNVERL